MPSSSAPSVLSIQSSVAYGHVGNSAAVFPMQYRGVNVSPVHTLQYSSHVQYNCGFAGTRIPEQDIRALLAKLHILAEQNGSSAPLFSHIITGYIGSPEAVDAIADFVKEVKANGNISKKPFFFCDPVCGDNGRLYVLQAVAEGIRDRLVPQADAIAPNFFEASFLSGVHIDDDASAMAAAKKLHDLGPRIVVITSYAVKGESEDKQNPTPIEDKNDPNPHNSHQTRLHCLLSRKVTSADDKEGETRILQDVFAFKNVIGHWVGTGDIFAALILSELAIRNDESQLPSIVQHSLAIMNSLVHDTKENQTTVGGQRELRIIENRRLFELEGDAAAARKNAASGTCEHIIRSSP